MMKIEAAPVPFSKMQDRFIGKPYQEGLKPIQQLEEMAKIKGMSGFPVMYPSPYGDGKQTAKLFKSFGLSVGTVCPDVYLDPRFKNGTLTCMDKNMRKEMVKTIQESMDFCAEAGGVDILLWLAHDGYDYPFEDDYQVKWSYLIESLVEITGYRKDVKVTIEYKMKEPRTHQYISTVGKSLVICNEVGASNFGVALDYGHALYAGENPAESAALLKRYDKLFHVHLNDNYRGWDDDLMVGSVTFWETLEFFYWLHKIDYDGWYTIDIWPSRSDGVKALQESIIRANRFMEIASNLPYEEFKRMQNENAVMDIMHLLTQTIMG